MKKFFLLLLPMLFASIITFAQPWVYNYSTTSTLPFGNGCKSTMTINGTVTLQDNGEVTNHGTILITFSGDCFGLQGQTIISTFSDTKTTQPVINYSRDVLTLDQKAYISDYIDAITDKY